MVMFRKSAILDMAHTYWPSYQESRQKALRLDRWLRGEQLGTDADEPESRFHGNVFIPSHKSVDEEFTQIAQLAPGTWADLITKSLGQTAHVDGIRLPKQNENIKTWDTFQANRWGMKQTAIHHAAIGLSTAYGLVLPGKNPLTGDKMTKMLTRSPIRMASFYDDDNDEWARFAMEAEAHYVERVDGLAGFRIHDGWHVTIHEPYVSHYLYVKGEGLDRKDWTYISFEEHPLPVTPVARCVNRMDLDGRAIGEIEPVLPLLRRIDQDAFDRLIVQRFGAWKVRYIAGMAKPTDQTKANAQAIQLSVSDILISGNPDTRFGTLDATDLKGFIEANDADLRMLAAVTQTPPHHLLGLSSNLQAEALAAAESGLQRKSVDFKANAGEFHEQMARMVAMVNGERAEAISHDMKVVWRDTESRSLSQAADALGKLAIQLKVPVEMLWERIPGWSDTDSERAKQLIESGSAIDQVLAEVAAQMERDNAASAAAAAQQAGDAGGDADE